MDCFEDLEKFLEEPPACVRIQQEAVVKESGRLCVPFSCPVLDSILAEMQLTCFVCDFTYKVCKEGLLLGWPMRAERNRGWPCNEDDSGFLCGGNCGG